MRLLLGSLILTFAVQAHAAEPSKRKVIRLDALKVEGRIQKPQAFYILQRSNLNYDGLEQKENFLPLIHKVVDDKPF
jgi:hypothetical protein